MPAHRKRAGEGFFQLKIRVWEKNSRTTRNNTMRAGYWYAYDTEATKVLDLAATVIMSGRRARRSSIVRDASTQHQFVYERMLLSTRSLLIISPQSH